MPRRGVLGNWISGETITDGSRSGWCDGRGRDRIDGDARGPVRIDAHRLMLSSATVAFPSTSRSGRAACSSGSAAGFRPGRRGRLPPSEPRFTGLTRDALELAPPVAPERTLGNVEMFRAKATSSRMRSSRRAAATSPWPCRRRRPEAATSSSALRAPRRDPAQRHQIVATMRRVVEAGCPEASGETPAGARDVGDEDRAGL